ncbi:hypothetical protein [Ponticoccus alexandrii]|nr:hypothetical protein [Ponticoccus alexandrii]ETA50776.1 hypothetical protein P279_17615 [Rhodobacteraceae bacterium PD-2]
MKLTLAALASTLCLALPAMASAEAFGCKDPAPVFAAAGASTFDLPKLAQTVGNAELDGRSLRPVAQQVRTDFPEASEADVADIMITAFCTYLNDDAPASHRSQSNIRNFEREVYGAVFGGAAPESYQCHDWLCGD